MIYGTSWGSGWGDPDRQVKVIDVSVLSPSSFLLRLMPSAGFGDSWWGIYVNNKKETSIYIAENEMAVPLVVKADIANESQSIVVIHEGQGKDVNNYLVARYFDLDSAEKASIRWTWPTEVIGLVENGLSNWTLTGFKYVDLDSVADFITRGTLPIDLDVTTGIATIIVYDRLGTTVLATGSGSVGTTVTLIGTLAGTVDVAAGAASKTDTLYIRYPTSMAVLRGLSDPPSVTVDTVAFNQQSEYFWTEGDDLTAGTYYYALTPLSDTDDTGDQSATYSVVITGVPVAPTDLAYVSGDNTNTVLGFTASTTVGATYRAYLQNVDDEYMDMTTPAATAIAGATTIALPTITGGAGIAFAIVRAVLAGVEDKNGSLISLEYNGAGTYIVAKPNTPTLGAISVSSGTSVLVAFTYPTFKEQATPTRVNIYSKVPGGAYDFGTPDGFGSLGTANGGTRIGTATVTLANGWHYVTAKAETAAGGLSQNNADEALVYVSDVNTSAPTSINVSVNRG